MVALLDDFAAVKHQNLIAESTGRKPVADVDGGLIGGAALKADSFMGIITAF